MNREHSAESRQTATPGLMSRHHLDDLGVRAASALVLVVTAVGSLFAGWLFVLYWLVAALAVHWEWQRLIGAPLPWLRFFGGELSSAPPPRCFTSDAGRTGVRDSARSPRPFAPGRRGRACCSGPRPACSTRAGCCLRRWRCGARRSSDLRNRLAFRGSLGHGRRRLFRRPPDRRPEARAAISPGKTWSGFGIGIVCGASLGALVAHSGPTCSAPLLPCLPARPRRRRAGAGRRPVRSWIKRRFDVKDSSRPHSRPRRRHGQARRFYRRGDLRRPVRRTRGLPSAAAGLLYLAIGF